MNTLNSIQSLKSKMKIEFSTQLLGLLFLSFLPTYFEFTKQLALVYYFFYIIILLFAIYFLGRFYTFFQKASNIKPENRADASWFYQELRIELANYKSYHYITTFLISGFAITYCYFNKITLIPLLNKIEILLPGQMNLIVICFTTMLILFVLSESTIRWSYGKELKNLKSALDA